MYDDYYFGVMSQVNLTSMELFFDYYILQCTHRHCLWHNWAREFTKLYFFEAAVLHCFDNWDPIEGAWQISNSASKILLLFVSRVGLNLCLTNRIGICRGKFCIFLSNRIHCRHILLNVHCGFNFGCFEGNGHQGIQMN